MIDSLRQDHATLTELLAARRAVTVVTLPVGMRILFNIYLTILEDALTTLNSLIVFYSGVHSENENKTQDTLQASEGMD